MLILYLAIFQNSFLFKLVLSLILKGLPIYYHVICIYMYINIYTYILPILMSLINVLVNTSNTMLTVVEIVGIIALFQILVEMPLVFIH